MPERLLRGVRYLVPGAPVLLGLSPFSQTMQPWFATAPKGAPSLGEFLYLTVTALATGMTVSAVRWAQMDTLHGYTGLSLPQLDGSLLGDRVGAFTLLINIHYRQYQYYASTFDVSATAYNGYRVNLGGLWPLGLPDLAFLVLEAVFFARSAKRKIRLPLDPTWRCSR